jgi:undecaprenyl-diphosphatase
VDLAYSRSTIRIVGSRARRLYARSFPSQHAACALAAALAVGTGRGTPWLVLALLIAIAIGFSRVLVGAHYLGDVIVGWAMGIAGWMVAVSY